MKYRTLMVDDEPMARKRLHRFVSNIDDLEIIGECSNGPTSVTSIHEQKPDLVFLDVQMPGMSGFEVLQEVRRECLPVVIFVTAYDEFALRAFEAQALDYVLKPFRQERIVQAVDRARVHLQGRNSVRFRQDLSGLFDKISAAGNSLDRFLVKSEGRILFVKPTEIDWVEAVGDYVKLYLAAESHMLRATMADMEKRLTPAGFARIHRSRLVNLDSVKELRPLFQGESIVLLKNGTRLKASRGCLKDLQERLNC